VVIKAGSSLLVPRSATMNQDVAVKVADNGQLSLAPEVVQKRVMLRAGKGESVATIARKYKVNADQVAQWNKVGVSASFKPGQQVVVFLVGASQTKSPSGAAKVTARRKAVRSTGGPPKRVR
jgi:membrane-bound lytic murein transglycosylase D